MAQVKEIPLGSEVKDIITGFKGIAIAHTVYLTGCDQYLVQSQTGKDEPIKPRWFDVEELNVTKKKKVEVHTRATSGPRGDSIAKCDR